MSNILLSLKISATGWDEIPVKLLKLSNCYIVQPLTFISNLSLSQGMFPDKMKLANVIPLYKSDDPMYFNHYRPVALLCILSKVFEKIMYSRLLEFLENYQILYKNQFGFRKKHSTYMALMILVDKITKSLENGEFVIGIFLDFSKAFDTVNHDILLQKLHHYGIRGTAFMWFKSYLSCRYQYVTYNSTESSKKLIKCGVPQGSILGPLLFLVYINDLANVCKTSMPLLFTDDTNIFFSGKDPHTIEAQINEELKYISEWLKTNRLSLNVKKTHYIIFATRNFTRPNLNVQIEGHTIDETYQTKFLGVIIDSNLTWKQHIMYISGKIAKGIGIIKKARKVLDKETLVTLYNSFIYPYLCYCSHVWSGTSVTYMNRLIILQKKIIRIIAGVRPRSHSKPLFKELNIMNIENIGKFQIARFMYHIYNHNALDIFISMFTRNKEIHTHETRQSDHFHIPLTRKEIGKANIRYKGAIIWNDIMKSSIRVNESEYVFIKDLRYMILNGMLWHLCLLLLSVFVWNEDMYINLCMHIYMAMHLDVCSNISMCEQLVSMYVYIPIARNCVCPCFYRNISCFESYIWQCQISGLSLAQLLEINIVVAPFAPCVGNLFHINVEQIRSS